MGLISWALAGFALGSVPIGLVVARVAGGLDIRRYGTGNTGASNVFRNVGLAPAAVAGVASFAQGAVPPLAALALAAGQPAAAAAAAAGAAAGYAWSPWLRFRGGSAVGVATGGLAILSPAGLVPLLAGYAAGAALRQPAPGVLAGLAAYLASISLRATPASVRAAAFTVVAIVLAKRLEGATADLGSPDAGRRLRDRLIFDRKPGRALVGRIE